MVIGLNPSTADETLDDPTIRRCVGFAKRWGFSGLSMTNLFAWRDTQPAGMKAAVDPVGPDNDGWLLNCASGAGRIIAAWGNHGSHLGRDRAVVRLLAGGELLCFQMNEDGSPAHPLYMPGDINPIPYARGVGLLEADKSEGGYAGGV
jgi:hypothetical protein